MFNLFKKDSYEPVKVVFVQPPKQDLGTRIKSLDFDPVSLGVGALVPALGIGIYKGLGKIGDMRSMAFIMKAVIADVDTASSSYEEYCERVHDYLKDHPLTAKYNLHQRAKLENALLRKLDKYWAKHPAEEACDDDIDIGESIESIARDMGYDPDEDLSDTGLGEPDNVPVENEPDNQVESPAPKEDAKTDE